MGNKEIEVGNDNNKNQSKPWNRLGMFFLQILFNADISEMVLLVFVLGLRSSI